MANELKMITKNNLNDGWIDDVPAGVMTGYVNQNTVIQGIYNGLDKINAEVSGADIIVKAGGIVDFFGILFLIESDVVISAPISGKAIWYFKVVNGNTSLKKSIELTDERGTYSASKNGYYSTDGARLINIMYNRFSKSLTKLSGEEQAIGNTAIMQTSQQFVTRGDVFLLSLAAKGVHHSLPIDPSASAFNTNNGTILLLKRISSQNKVYEISTTDFSVLQEVVIPDSVSANLSKIAYCDKTNEMILIDSSNGNVHIFEGITNKLASTFTFNGGARDGIAVDVDGFLISVKINSSNREATLYKSTLPNGVDVFSRLINDAHTTFPNPVSLAYDGVYKKCMILSSDRICTLDAVTFSVLSDSTMGAFASGGGAFDPSKMILYCNSSLGCYAQGGVI